MTNTNSKTDEVIFLETRHLTKQFGGLTAVKDISFQMPRGRIFSLIGPNGAGKTTLFNMLTGVYPPTTGDIIFNNRKITSPYLPKSKFRLYGLGGGVAGLLIALLLLVFNLTNTGSVIPLAIIFTILGYVITLFSATRILQHTMRPDEVTKLGIARTFQNIRLFANMTTLENVLVGEHSRLHETVFGAILRTPTMRKEEKKAEEKAHLILQFVGLADRANELAKNLPYGDQRRLEIARAMATDPELICLDEPAAGMNPHETNDLINLIQRIRDKGISILLIEHDMKVVMDISDQIIVLDYGVKIAEGNAEVIRNNPRVIEAYLGKESAQEENIRAVNPVQASDSESNNSDKV